MAVEVEIIRGRTALLVHDVVHDFIEAGGESADADLGRVLDQVERLLGVWRAAGLPVVFAAPGRGDPEIAPRAAGGARLVWGSPGVDVPARFGPRSGEAVIRKPRYGGFHGSGLTEWLRDRGHDRLAVCGLSLAGGVETTIRDAHNRDLACILVRDACLCRPIPDVGFGPVSREDVARVTLSVLAQRFARVMSVEEVRAALAIL